MLAVHEPEPPDVLVIPTLRELAARVPQALEAAIVPAVLFLASSRSPDLARDRRPAGWALGVVWWRRRRTPGAGDDGLAVVTLVVRSVIAFAADSTFLYFLQPTLGGLALAITFLVSVVIDRPLVRRFAGDFCWLPARVLARRRCTGASDGSR